jgi:hypothetical protein
MMCVGTSCRSDIDELADEVTAGDTVKPIKVQLELSVDNATATRAATGDTRTGTAGVEASCAEEVLIDPNLFHPFIFTNNVTGTSALGRSEVFVDEVAVDQVEYTAGSVAYDGGSYLITGHAKFPFTYSKSNNKFTFLNDSWTTCIWNVWANYSEECPSMKMVQGISTYADIEYASFVYSWPKGTLPSAEHPIPMYSGFLSSNVGKYASDTMLDLTINNIAKLNLVRSVAKIIIRSNDTLTDVTLNRCYTRGFAQPKGYYEQVLDNKLTDNHLNIPGESYAPDIDPGLAYDAPFTLMSMDSDPNDLNRRNYMYNYKIYVPEYRNVNQADTAQMYINFKLNSKKYSLKLGSYDYSIDSATGDTLASTFNTPYNILRNHIYDYTVGLSVERMLIRYKVLNWQELVADDIIFE